MGTFSAPGVDVCVGPRGEGKDGNVRGRGSAKSHIGSARDLRSTPTPHRQSEDVRVGRGSPCERDPCGLNSAGLTLRRSQADLVSA